MLTQLADGKAQKPAQIELNSSMSPPKFNQSHTVSLRAVMELFGERFRLSDVALKLIGSTAVSDTSAAWSRRSFVDGSLALLGFGALQSKQHNQPVCLMIEKLDN